MFKPFLAALVLGSSFSAAALEVEYFDFTNSKTYSITDDALLDNSLIDNNYPWMFTAAFDYVKTPLSIQDNDERTDDVIKSLQGLHIGGGVRLYNDLFIGAKTYLANIGGQNDGIYLGDTVLEAKWKFYQGTHSALALAPKVYLPLGSQGFTSNGKKVGESIGLNFERNFEWIQISLMAGFTNKPGATLNLGSDFTELDYKQSVYTAIGSVIPFSNLWALNVEAYRYNQLEGNQHPAEIYAGVRNQTTPSISSFFGASIGGAVDETSNDYRISAGVKFTPMEEKKVAAPAPKPAPVAPPVQKLMKREEGLAQEKKLYGTLVAYETIYFPNNVYVLDNFSKDVVKKFFATALRLRTKYKVVIEGFASTAGDHASNMVLSKDRIRETRAHLTTLGANDMTMTEVAYGDTAADATVDEALNRKVMLRLYKK